VIHLYALLDADGDVPDVHGLDDACVVGHRADGVTAVVSELARPVEASTEAALRHGDVVEVLASRNDAVLPARFGTAFGGVHALEREVASRSERAREALERVRGCVELSVRARLSHVELPESRPAAGRAYLEARHAIYERARRLADVVHAPLAELSREARWREALAAGGVARAAYLVPADAVAAFRSRVDALERAHPGVTLICTGPWPPYSFASLEERSAW
jgi:hypothetical protein